MKKSTLLLIIILGLALFLRVFRTSDLMGFYYDQGRDGLIIWDLIHKGKLFLIGPTTGIEGIFLGPFYYYLIAPFYALGNGNPVFPSVGLAVINVLAIAVLYYIGSKYFNKATGLLASLLITVSANLISAHRWLSNPTPLPLFALLALLSLLKIIHGFKKWWPILGLCAGLSLQLEAASAVFFIPASFLILLVNFGRIRSGLKTALFGVIAFGLTLLPQLYFDFRHDHILLKAFNRFLLSEKSFQPEVVGFFSNRLKFYFDNFSNILFIEKPTAVIAGLFLLILLLVFSKKLFQKSFAALLIWWATPLIFLLFYHGNHGYVWGYYFTGIYPVFVLLISALLVFVFNKSILFRPFILIFIFMSLFQNLKQIKADLFRPYPSVISLTTSTQAVDWAYRDANGMDFNIDVYVPPVIPFAYQYLVLWRGETFFHTQPLQGLTSRLYTIHEPENERPEYLVKWLKRQDSYGPVEAQTKFGDVTVERRTRISKP